MVDGNGILHPRGMNTKVSLFAFFFCFFWLHFKLCNFMLLDLNLCYRIWLGVSFRCSGSPPYHWGRKECTILSESQAL